MEWSLIFVLVILLLTLITKESYEKMGEYGTRRTLEFKEGEVIAEKFPIKEAWLNTGMVELSSLAQTPLDQTLTNGAAVLLQMDTQNQTLPNHPVDYS